MNSIDLTVITTPFGDELKTNIQNLPTLSKRLKTFLRYTPLKSGFSGIGREERAYRVVQLHKEGFSHRKIAEMVGLTHGGVTWILQREKRAETA